MGGRVEVNQSPRSVLHHHQHVEDSKGGGHRNAEVTRDDPPSVILKKSRPPLVASRLTIRWRRLRQVLPDCPWRNTQTEFQQQLVCDPLLAPRGVLARHSPNQALELDGDRSPASCGLPAPEEAEALAVPGDEGPRPHDGQGVALIEPAAEQHQRQAGRIVGPARIDLALLIECGLLAQEQILGRERSSGAQAETQKVD